MKKPKVYGSTITGMELCEDKTFECWAGFSAVYADYTLQKVAIADLRDSVRSALEEVSMKHVFDLIDAYNRGDDVPPIVLDENKKLMDGNHRLMAQNMLKRTFVDAYVRV